MIFQHSDADDAGITAKIECVAEDNAGNSFLAFYNGDGGNADERLRITSAGKFGINIDDNDLNFKIKISLSDGLKSIIDSNVKIYSDWP